MRVTSYGLPSGQRANVEQGPGNGDEGVAVKVFGFVQVHEVGRGHTQGFA